ncbi:probable zinc finger CCCH domain-containing protein 54 at N-terminal half [Coccomyxa sp. Obi]|nr:probable zinc finger CCCH domain-containing protein 54 at N-terminal half [Coccomyxa sp. Obi]
MCRISLHTADKTDVRRCPRQHNNRPKKPQGETPRKSGDAEDDALHGEDFMMYGLKVIPCNKTVPHEWSVCPFAHQGEKAVRRDLRTHYYTGVVCPDMKKNGHCPRGDECPFAHCVFEYWLHPTRYRTVMCTEGDKCTRTFCFFAHTPDELRQPELAELRKPPKQRRQEGTPQDAAHQTKPPADTATRDQAPEAAVKDLTGIAAADTEEVKKQLQVTQGGGLPAHGQHMPAQGDSLSTYIPEPPDFIGKRCVKPLQGAMQAPGIGGYGGGVTAADWQGNPISMHGNEPLTQVQVAAYLAGFAHALGQRAETRGPQPPPLDPRPHLNQHVPTPLHPLFQALAHQQPALYGAPVTEQAWAADVHPPQGRQQRQDQHQQLLGSSWVRSTDGCNSTFAAMKLSDFPVLQGTPLSVRFAPAAHPETSSPPDIPFSNNTWGVPNPPKINQVDATNPFSAESHRLPFDCIPDDYMHRDGGLPDWGSGSTNSYMETGCKLTEAPSTELDHSASSQAASLFSHATRPFNHRGSLDKTPSMQSDNFPEFSLF